MTRGSRRALTIYLWLVVAAAAPLVAVTAGQAVRAYRAGVDGRTALIVALFTLVIVLGETRPIPVSRGVESGDEITVSTMFGIGLLLVAPVFTAICAQTFGLLVDGVLHRRRPSRLLFNVAQYALSFVGARAVYALVTGRPFTPVAALGTPPLLPALVAGLVFVLINNVSVAVAVSLKIRARLSRVLVGDLRWQLTTTAPLVALGPLAVQAMMWTPLSIVLLLLPAAALHHTGTTAMRREQEALRDSLTGLANRAMLTTAAARALSESVGQTAMLLIDLDHFKDINDTLGHLVGDRMLIAVADRLRAEAGPDTLIARLGGDEFVVLAPGVDDRAAAVALAQRLCEAVRRTVVLEGVSLTVGCSIGISFGPEQATTVSDLLRCADVALYNAKTARGAVEVYDKADDPHSTAHLGLHADLRHALLDPRDTQLWVAFQPQYDLRQRRVAAVECLVRWDHPRFGSVAPDVFIPIAENTSLIDLLLDRVLDTVLGQLRNWDADGLRLDASVNLSARQLSDISLPEKVGRCLGRHGVSPQRLVLEVTESRLLSNPELSARIVRELHELGVRVSIDDFGTGYSSLAHLQRLAVHELKVDRSFTAEPDETGNAAIVRSIIDLGHNLGLRIVAEGVETADVADRLARMGCDALQGYLLGRPVPAAEVPAVVAAVPGRLVLPAAVRGDGARVLELVPPQAVPLQKAE